MSDWLENNSIVLLHLSSDEIMDKRREILRRLFNVFEENEVSKVAKSGSNHAESNQVNI